MTTTIHLPHFPLPLKIRRHASAKSMVLRLSPCGQEARLTIPSRVSERKALAFARSQKGWLEMQQAKTAQAIPFAAGVSLPLFGVECVLVHCASQRGISFTVEDTPQLLVGGMEEYFASRVERWVKQEAKKRFGEKALYLARQIEERPAAVTVRDTSSRWGSCSHARRISLNWRLAFAPAEVADYVIAHEVAHLKHFDHSGAFWQTVGRLHPDYADAKNWLRRYGRSLHRYGASTR